MLGALAVGGGPTWGQASGKGAGVVSGAWGNGPAEPGGWRWPGRTEVGASDDGWLSGIRLGDKDNAVADPGGSRAVEPRHGGGMEGGSREAEADGEGEVEADAEACAQAAELRRAEGPWKGSGPERGSLEEDRSMAGRVREDPGHNTGYGKRQTGDPRVTGGRRIRLGGWEGGRGAGNGQGSPGTPGGSLDLTRGQGSSPSQRRARAGRGESEA